MVFSWHITQFTLKYYGIKASDVWSSLFIQPRLNQLWMSTFNPLWHFKNEKKKKKWKRLFVKYYWKKEKNKNILPWVILRYFEKWLCTGGSQEENTLLFCPHEYRAIWAEKTGPLIHQRRIWPQLKVQMLLILQQISSCISSDMIIRSKCVHTEHFKVSNQYHSNTVLYVMLMSRVIRLYSLALHDCSLQLITLCTNIYCTR